MSKYGIWNSLSKRFVYGIKVDSSSEARRELHKKAGNPYCWRYIVKEIPESFKNPPNRLFVKRGNNVG